jgi:hypothetical protein
VLVETVAELQASGLNQPQLAHGSPDRKSL